MPEINIIPYPLELDVQQGFFELDEDTRIFADPANMDNAGYLRKILSKAKEIADFAI